MAVDNLKVNVLGDGFGAEIIGADIAGAMDDAYDTVRKAVLDYGFVAVRGQDGLTPKAHIAFTRCFGTPTIHLVDSVRLEGFPEVMVISNKKRADGSPVGFEDAGRFWHSDVSYDEEPPMGSLLFADEIPPEGGDTLYCDTIAAYAALGEQTRNMIDGMRAIHSYANCCDGLTVLNDVDGLQKECIAEVTHPVVRTHPETGRKALYVSPGFTSRFANKTEEESRPLLQELFAHQAEDRFIHRHVWQPHDLVFWDNCATMHHSTPYDKTRYTRHMHRTTIAGDRPI